MNLEIFKNENFEIRVAVDETGEPLFCLADVCKILGLDNSRQAKTRLDQKGVTSIDTLTNGGVQKLDFINEPNLYRLIFQSRKSEAEVFQEWVFSEILPSIRKTGSYTQKPLTQAEILAQSAALLVEQERRTAALETKTEEIRKEQLKAKHNINRLLNNDNYMTLIAFMNLHGISQKGYHIPSLGKRAKKLSDEQGAFMGAVIDPRYGRINTYSTEILKQIFKVA